MKKRKDGRYVETIKIGDKRKYFYGTSPSEVKAKLREYEDCGEIGRTFREVADEWEDSHNTEIKYNTQEYYKPITRRVIECFGDRPIRQITAADIKEFLYDLQNKQYGKKEVTAHKNVLNMIYKYAISNKPTDAEINVVRDVALPKNLISAKRELPNDEYIKKIDAIKGAGDGLLPYMLLWSGCRRCEALALRWSDIDFEIKRISITKIIEYHSNEPMVREGTKTEAGMRRIILTDKLAEALKPLRGDSKEYIFGGDKPWTNTKLRRTWERFCKSNDMTKTVKVGEKDAIKPDLTPHQLRHAYVTMLFEAGVDEKTAMAQTGHADEKTIREIYTHLREKKTAEAVEKINKFEW